ncbi:unnamed protein product, partial [Staurois parvus]
MSSHSNRSCAAPGALSVAIGGAQCPSDTADHQSRKELKMSARSCDQLCPITADHISATCQCPSVPALSAHPCTCQCPSVPYQCHISVPISAISMPHISAHLSCLSVSPISASQC